MQLMKIIQVTDTHLMPRGTELNGLNPIERLEGLYCQHYRTPLRCRIVHHHR